MTVIETVAADITSNETFWNDLDITEWEHHRRRLGVGELDVVPVEVLARLAESAPILALSRNDQHRYLAYRIAVLIAQLHESGEAPALRVGATTALARLGHFPALDFFEREVDYIPTTAGLWREAQSSRQINTVSVNGENSYTLTDYQRRLLQALQSRNSVATAAPTSAGKSFVVQLYIEQRLIDSKTFRAVIIVPTRALIAQTSTDLGGRLRRAASAPITYIRTSPITEDEERPDHEILVYTQERLSLHLAQRPRDCFDIVVVDEAQMLSEARRGILLSSVLREALSRDERTQALLIMPNVLNPLVATEAAGRPDAIEITTSLPAVTQNIFIFEPRKGRPDIQDLFLRDDHQEIDLICTFIDSTRPTLKSEKLARAVRILGRSGGNLIYADGPSEAEGTANAIVAGSKAGRSVAREQLRDFVADTIHPDYCLARLALYGIGLHYGHIPSQVRQAIEDAFNDGVLHNIVTTSTLLYGVNLPARNLFLLNPHRGGPLPTGDFWNLAGRAGRLQREFEGNVYLVEYRHWDSKPLAEKKEYQLETAVHKLLTEHADDFVQFIATRGQSLDARFKDRLGYETLSSQLQQAAMDGELLARLKQLGLDNSPEIAQRVADAVEGLVTATSLDAATLKSSPSVPSWLQQKLYDYFLEQIGLGRVRFLLPKRPNAVDAYDRLLEVLRLCITFLQQPPDESHTYLALLAHQWMRGDSLRMIIDKQHRYGVDHGSVQPAEIDKSIRKVLSDIEEHIRFRAVRIVGCYIAVLKQALRNTNREEQIASIPALPSYLEMGLSRPVDIMFANLGLSRYASRKLGDVYPPGLGSSDARSWLLGLDLSSLGFSKYLISEIETALRNIV